MKVFWWTLSLQPLEDAAEGCEGMTSVVVQPLQRLHITSTTPRRHSTRRVSALFLWNPGHESTQVGPSGHPPYTSALRRRRRTRHAHSQTRQRSLTHKHRSLARVQALIASKNQSTPSWTTTDGTCSPRISLACKCACLRVLRSGRGASVSFVTIEAFPPLHSCPSR